MVLFNEKKALVSWGGSAGVQRSFFTLSCTHRGVFVRGSTGPPFGRPSLERDDWVELVPVGPTPVEVRPESLLGSARDVVVTFPLWERRTYTVSPICKKKVSL